MELSNEMITYYSKKILGFAYSKTSNPHQAEDLAQEIFCSLVDSLRKHENIADLDGFIYTVSCYTWSKFLRNNKKHWVNLDVDEFHNIQTAQNVEKETINKLLIEKLEKEIAYLSGLHRKIILLFYYENKTGEEISKLLEIPHSTIRWHLTEIKKKLKAGIEMNNNLSYQPQRLYQGIDGSANDTSMRGIGINPLVDNICIACYGNPLTIEELSKTLQVAAAYIEPLVNDLLYMDYLKQIGKNKYQTNFYIRTAQLELTIAKYKLHNIAPCAKAIISVFRSRIDDICKIGFVGSDLDHDFLLWALIPLFLQKSYYASLDFVLNKNNVQIETPKRKDGSQHWVSSGFRYQPQPAGFTEEEILFASKCTGHGIKTRISDSNEYSLQYDGYATIKTGITWREFGSNNDLRTIKRMATVIRSGEEPNEYDKAAFVPLIESRYAKTIDGKPVLLIPYFNENEYKMLEELLDTIHKEVGETLFADFIEGFSKVAEKEIPDFISPEEKIYLKYQAYPQYAVLYWLADNNLLRYPTDSEALRLCTVVWSN
ncbi:sigma-70 family RNA polymerase sigma factor [Eubacteriales bacterium OttesenSCG-928-G02]|nr:sigma-70 family RNA polymerase sigma factor [Eubacteriales bacterium OttesenSCG-928-G02]